MTVERQRSKKAIGEPGKERKGFNAAQLVSLLPLVRSFARPGDKLDPFKWRMNMKRGAPARVWVPVAKLFHASDISEKGKCIEGGSSSWGKSMGLVYQRSARIRCGAVRAEREDGETSSALGLRRRSFRFLLSHTHTPTKQLASLLQPIYKSA